VPCAATDNLKLTFPIAAATLQMAWGLISLPGDVPEMQDVLEELTWATTYLLACRTSNDSLVSQVSSGHTSEEGIVSPMSVDKLMVEMAGCLLFSFNTIVTPKFHKSLQTGINDSDNAAAMVVRRTR
jgi:hypothetical protein